MSEIKKEWVLGVDEELIEVRGILNGLQESYAGQRMEINCLEERCDAYLERILELERLNKKYKETNKVTLMTFEDQSKRIRFLEECLIKAGLG